VKVQTLTVAFKSTLYAGGTNSCFLKVSLRWRYKQLLSNQPLRWRYKQLLSEGIPTLEVINSCFLKASLCKRYKQLLP